MKRKILSLVLAVLCMISIIPMTAISTSALGYAYHPMPISGFEPPYGGGGGKPNYTIVGWKTGTEAKDDFESAMAYYRDPEVATPYLTQNGQQFDFSGHALNLYSYGQARDNFGKTVPISEALYGTVHYYWDTSERSEEDPLSSTFDVSTLEPRFYWYSLYHNGESVSVGGNCVPEETIVTDEWATLTYDFTQAYSQMGQIKDSKPWETGDTSWTCAQYAYCFFGVGNFNIPIGDKVYIGAIEFTDFDPRTEAPSGQQEFQIFKSEEDYNDFENGELLVDELLDDLSVYTFTEPESIDEGLELRDYYDPDTGASYKPGDKLLIDRGEGYYLYARYNKVAYGPQTVGLSATGTIDGADMNVYKTLKEADTYIAAHGGVGSVLVDGVVNLDPASGPASNGMVELMSTELTIKKYDSDDDTIVFHPNPDGGGYTNSYHNFYAPNGLTLTFDDIHVLSNASAEAFAHFENIHLHFGANVTYSHNEGKHDLYFLQMVPTSHGQGFDLTVDGPVGFQMLAPGGGYATSGTKTYTGDYNFTFNNGTYYDYMIGARNGGRGGTETFTGNISVTVNDANFAATEVRFSETGSSSFNGTLRFVVNGGKFTNGLTLTNARNVNNAVFIINAKTITDKGQSLPKVSVAASTVNNSTVIFNNAELCDDIPDLSPYDTVKVMNGTADAVPEGGALKYTITSDDPQLKDVYANGVKLTAAADGTYTLPKGVVTVTFVGEGMEAHDLIYRDEDTDIVAGSYYEGTEVTVEAVFPPKDGFTFAGYTYGGEDYAVGSTFTMPNEEAVLEAKWDPIETASSIYYVSSTGSGSGTSSDDPMGSAAAALAAIGDGDGVIVVMDRLSDWPWTDISSGQVTTLKNGQTIRVTGMDPLTEEVYPNAAITRKAAKQRVDITDTGTFILDHITDVLPGTESNHGISIRKSTATLEIGTGYSMELNGSKIGTQLMTLEDNVNPTIKLDGKAQFISLGDWGTTNITGDLNIEVGPNAAFTSGAGVNLGEDGVSDNRVTVAGKTFVTFDHTKTVGTQTPMLTLGGQKAGVSTTINGLQVLLIETDAQVAYHTLNNGFTNTGDQYIVRVNKLIEGAAVRNAGFGKLAIEVPEGTVAKIREPDGGITELATSSIYTLKSNKDISKSTSISFVTDVKLNVTFGDGEPTEYNAGEELIIPADTGAADGQLFVYYTSDHDGETAFFANDAYVIDPETSDDIVFTPHYIDKNDAKIYISDAAVGAKGGFTKEGAVSSFKDAEKSIAVLLAADVPFSFVIVDSATVTANLELPTTNQTITITGDTPASVFSFRNVNAHSDIIFKDITLEDTQQYTHLTMYGCDLTIDTGVTKKEGSQAISVHLGQSGGTWEGDQEVVVKSNNVISDLYVGPHYNQNGAADHKQTGNVHILVDGGSVGTVAYGDGYSGYTEKMTHDGYLIVELKAGTVDKVSLPGYAKSSKGVIVHNYSPDDDEVSMIHKVGDDSTDMQNPEDFAEIPFPVYYIRYENIVPTSVSETGAELPRDAQIVETETPISGTMTLPEAAGRYTVKGAELSVEENLTIAGAQIRVASGEDVKQGLRFVAQYTDELKTQYADNEYGFILLPKVMLGEDEKIDATKKYDYNEKQYDPAIVKSDILFADEDGYVVYTAVLTDLSVKNYKTEYAAQTYIKLDDGSYIYGETYSTSVYAIAQEAISQHNAGTKPLDEATLKVMQDIVSQADAQ